MSDERVTALPCPSGHPAGRRNNNNIYGAWWQHCGDGNCSWRAAGDTEAEAIAAWNTRVPDPRIAALEAQVAELRGAGEWQDIATAPKDGTWVLTWGDGIGIAKCFPVPEVQTSGWEPDTTHWMPLPAAPAIRALAAEPAT